MTGLAPIVAVLGYACLAAAFTGCIFTLLECVFVLCFADARPPSATNQTSEPAVTILKPLHGAEPDLIERLRLLCRQDYAGPVQLLLGTQRDGDAVAAIASRLRAEFPDRAIDLVIDPRPHGGNRKIANLINMAPSARHDILVLSDSDIVVGADYLRNVVATLAAPGVGAVTCLYYGLGRSFWSRLAALTINTHFLPQAIAASRFGIGRYCGGATIALRRAVLERTGGFAALADVLADDFAIGAAVRSLGHEVAVAPFAVGHCCFENDLRHLVLHQLRAARTIRSIEPLGYAGTLVTHSLPLALVGMLSGSIAAFWLAAAAVVCPVVLYWSVTRRFGLPRRDYWLVPLQEVLAFAIFVVSFAGAGVHWRGLDYRVSSDGTLIERET
jgi:ceramide glucosyltransferase